MAHKHPYVQPEEGALSVFTDGSSFSTPRRGGIGVHFIYVDNEGNETSWDITVPGVASATNNQMELLAVITAMKEIQGRRFRSDKLDRATKINIYTDSQYVAENIGSACSVWPKNEWMTRAGRPVENVPLWKDLVRELKKLSRLKRVNIKWAKGHSASNPHNKVADKLAKESAARPTRPPLVPVAVRRKTTTSMTELGSVEMLGQRLTIRIVTAEPLPAHRLSKYRYEVLSRRSRYYGKVDIAYSEDPLMRAGHTYRVTMNRDQNYPMIKKCHAEVLPATEPNYEESVGEEPA